MERYQTTFSGVLKLNIFHFFFAGEEDQNENENEAEQENDNDQQQDQNDNGQQQNQNQNNQGNDDANQYDDASQYDDAYVEEEEPNPSLIQRFNNMSRASKIWTVILLIWGFIILFACLIMCVRGCTEQRKDGKKQPLMSSRSVSTHNSDGSGNGNKRKGWFARMGERNREKLERRRSRSRSRGRSRSRSRSRGRN